MGSRIGFLMILEPCGLLPSTLFSLAVFSLAAQDGIRVFVGSCFIRAGQPPPIAPSALSDFRAVGRGGASRRPRMFDLDGFKHFGDMAPDMLRIGLRIPNLSILAAWPQIYSECASECSF